MAEPPHGAVGTHASSPTRAAVGLHLATTFVLSFGAQALAMRSGLSEASAPPLAPSNAVGLVMLLAAPDGRRLPTALTTLGAGLVAALALGWTDPSAIAIAVGIPLVISWVGAALAARLLGPRPSLDHAAPLLRLAGLVAAVISPASALLWTLLHRELSPDGVHWHFVEWYIPELVMTLMLLPALWPALTWRRRLQRTEMREVIAGAAMMGTGVLAVALVAANPTISGIVLPISLAAVPVLLVTAYRFGVGLTAWTAIAMLVTLLYLSNLGIGPFAASRPAGYVRDVAVLLYVGTLGISTMLLAAVLAELRTASQRFSSFLGATDSPVIVVDADRRLVGFSDAANEVFQRLGGTPLRLGADPLEQLRSAPSVDGRRRDGWSRALEGESSSFASEMTEGNRFELRYDPMRDADGNVIGAKATAVDIAAREREELERLRAGRLGAIGRLAGGVAHDINNLMTVVLGQTFLLREQLSLSPETAEAVEAIEDTVDRTRRLTNQLLTFARAQVIAPRVLLLPRQVDRIMGLVRRVVEETVRCEVEHQGEPWAIRIDEGQLEQVLLNLATNARDAMPAGGTLRITTTPCRLADPEAGRLGLAPGEYVELRVADSGVGMPAHLLASVFDPFVTTKGSKGTGLGLATVQAIVRGAGGAVAAESQPGDGTTFRLLFPRTLEALAADEARVARKVPRGRARLVVCEDQPAIRRAVVRMLESVGYDVVEATGGTDALERLARPDAAVDLLITDVVMPGMDGPELLRRARERHPELRALLITGYVDGDALADFAPSGPKDAVLQKPFRGEQLIDAVERLLHQEA